MAGNRGEITMRFGVLILLLMFSVPIASQEEQDLTFIGELFADLVTPKTPAERCQEQQDEILEILNATLTVLEIASADRAWNYVDHAFVAALKAMQDCHESENEVHRLALDEIFKIINELDDTIACKYHLQLGNEQFEEAQKAYKEEDMEESEFQIHNAIFSMKEAMRFCVEESDNYKFAAENLDMLENKALRNFD